MSSTHDAAVAVHPTDVDPADVLVADRPQSLGAIGVAALEPQTGRLEPGVAHEPGVAVSPSHCITGRSRHPAHDRVNQADRHPDRAARVCGKPVLVASSTRETHNRVTWTALSEPSSPCTTSFPGSFSVGMRAGIAAMNIALGAAVLLIVLRTVRLASPTRERAGPFLDRNLLGRSAARNRARRTHRRSRRECSEHEHERGEPNERVHERDACLHTDGERDRLAH